MKRLFEELRIKNRGRNRNSSRTDSGSEFVNHHQIMCLLASTLLYLVLEAKLLNLKSSIMSCFSFDELSFGLFLGTMSTHLQPCSTLALNNITGKLLGGPLFLNRRFPCRQ